MEQQHSHFDAAKKDLGPKPEISQAVIDAFIYASGRDYSLSEVTDAQFDSAYKKFSDALDANDFAVCRWVFQEKYPGYPLLKIEKQMGQVLITTSVILPRKNRAGASFQSQFRVEELLSPDIDRAACAIEFEFIPEFRDDDPKREGSMTFFASDEIKHQFDERRRTLKV